MGWTDERVDLLKNLWQDGLSASQISQQLGGVSRNAVIGKIHRLGLSGRGAPSTPQHPTSKGPRPVRPRTPKPVRPQQPAAARQDRRMNPRFAAEGPGTATCLTLGMHMCKWPIGDPLADSFTYCGRRCNESGPYCHEHAAVAYQPAPAKTRGADELARSLRGYI